MQEQNKETPVEEINQAENTVSEQKSTNQQAKKSTLIFDETGRQLNDLEVNEFRLKRYEKIAGQLKLEPEMVAVIHKQLAKNTTDSELMYFLTVAKAAGLNPFNKEIWCYKDKQNNLIILTGRDGFLTCAQRHAKYGGIRSHEVCANDEFSMIMSNETLEIKHAIKPSTAGRGQLLGAYAIVYRHDAKEYATWVDFTRYNKGHNTWSSHPEEMIKKVAEAHALDKAFGIVGVQAAEEYQITNGVAEPIPNSKSEPLNK